MARTSTLTDLRADGMHNDARMNVTLAIPVATYGAPVANYVRVGSLTTSPDGRITAAKVTDRITTLNGRT